jgi:hypothetical protein
MYDVKKTVCDLRNETELRLSNLNSFCAVERVLRLKNLNTINKIKRIETAPRARYKVMLKFSMRKIFHAEIDFRSKIHALPYLLGLIFLSIYLFNFGTSNMGYVDPNIYSGAAGNYKTFYEVFAKSNTYMEKYSILRVLHLVILNAHQQLFNELSIYTIQIMYLIINFIIMLNFGKLFNIQLSRFSILSIYWIFIIPTYILETRWNYVQITGATITLYGLYNFIRYCYFRKRLNLIILGVCISFATNTHLKYTIVLILFLLSALLINAGIQNNDKIKIKLLLRDSASGFVLGQIVIETLFYLMLGRVAQPVLIQTFITPLTLASRRLEGVGIGEYRDVTLSSLIDLKYAYILTVVFIFLFSIIFIINKSFSNNYDDIEVVKWVFILTSAILLFIFSSIFLFKSPILEASWYYNTIWPMYGLVQFLVLNLIFLKLKGFQKEIIFYAICLFLVYLFFYYNLPNRELLFIIIGILFFGLIRTSPYYLLSTLGISILVLQFFQPPVGGKLKINHEQYAYREQSSTTRSLEFSKDQIWFSSLYSDLYIKQQSIIPIWYKLESGLGDMQSSIGFCVTDLHDCAGNGIKPDLKIWMENNGNIPKKIIILDTMDKSSLRIARSELKNEDFVMTEMFNSPSKSFIVGVFEKVEIK